MSRVTQRSLEVIELYTWKKCLSTKVRHLRWQLLSSSFFFCHQTSSSVTKWSIPTKLCQKYPLVHHYSGYEAQNVTCHTEVTRGHWTLRVKKLRHGPIFTKFSVHMCIDETKRKVNYKIFVRGQELSLEVKRSFSLKMLLVRGKMTDDFQNLSKDSPWPCTYKVLLH